MTDNKQPSVSKEVDINDIQQEFLSLRVGEEIPRLEILEIRKVVNKNAQNNLSGVDYSYLIETADNKLLRVSSWALWRQIAIVLKKAGKVQATLELKHPQIGEYLVRAI